MGNIIELRNVAFSAQEGIIVQGITVEFAAGKTTAIVGPSGCGKSTVLKISAGLLVPDQGEVLFMGKDVNQMSRAENLAYRSKSAFVFQDSALWANQNLYQILELPLRIHHPGMSKKERAERIREVTAQVGYKKNLDIRPSRLSMGEQKLIGFARALLCKPALLYLDEWTESLDESSAERLNNIVKESQKEGVSIIFVSHDMRIIKELADFVVMIIDGQISARAPIDQIIHDLLLKDFLKLGEAS